MNFTVHYVNKDENDTRYLYYVLRLKNNFICSRIIFFFSKLIKETFLQMETGEIVLYVHFLRHVSIFHPIITFNYQNLFFSPRPIVAWRQFISNYIRLQQCITLLMYHNFQRQYVLYVHASVIGDIR